LRINVDRKYLFSLNLKVQTVTVWRKYLTSRYYYYQYQDMQSLVNC
jgi:hypothetical protein